MGLIGKKKKKGTPEVSTASLPDIIFTLLFFFMVSAKVKDATLKVNHDMPSALDTKKLTTEDKIATIHIGKPSKKYEKVYGTNPVIQLDDQVITDVREIQPWVLTKKQAVPYALRPKFLVNIKADGKVPYSVINDVKTELRKADVLKINYDAKTLSY